MDVRARLYSGGGPMPTDFSGAWKCVEVGDAGDFEASLKCVGVPWFIRKIAKLDGYGAGKEVETITMSSETQVVDEHAKLEPFVPELCELIRRSGSMKVADRKYMFMVFGESMYDRTSKDGGEFCHLQVQQLSRNARRTSRAPRIASHAHGSVCLSRSCRSMPRSSISRHRQRPSPALRSCGRRSALWTRCCAVSTRCRWTRRWRS